MHVDYQEAVRKDKTQGPQGEGRELRVSKVGTSGLRGRGKEPARTMIFHPFMTHARSSCLSGFTFFNDLPKFITVPSPDRAAGRSSEVPSP